MTLPELNRRLLAARLDALVVVPASLDPREVEQHFAGAWVDPGIRTCPNGSTVRIRRGRPGALDLQGFHLDLAVVLDPLEAEALREIRARLVARNGAMFAPFALEVPGEPQP